MVDERGGVSILSWSTVSYMMMRRQVHFHNSGFGLFRIPAKLKNYTDK